MTPMGRSSPIVRAAYQQSGPTRAIVDRPPIRVRVGIPRESGLSAETEQGWVIDLTLLDSVLNHPIHSLTVPECFDILDDAVKESLACFPGAPGSVRRDEKIRETGG